MNETADQLDETARKGETYNDLTPVTNFKSLSVQRNVAVDRKNLYQSLVNRFDWKRQFLMPSLEKCVPRL